MSDPENYNNPFKKDESSNENPSNNQEKIDKEYSHFDDADFVETENPYANPFGNDNNKNQNENESKNPYGEDNNNKNNVDPLVNNQNNNNNDNNNSNNQSNEFNPYNLNQPNNIPNNNMNNNQNNNDIYNHDIKKINDIMNRCELLYNEAHSLYDKYEIQKAINN